METKCFWCNKGIIVPEGEVNRTSNIGRTRWFCSASCSVRYGNSLRTNQVVRIIKQCLFCRKDFEAKTDRHEADFCSRPCASSGSVTEYRRETARKTALASGNVINGSIEMLSKAMKSREKTKYINIDNYLNELKIKHEFEYPLKIYIYDLAIFDKKIFIEFDEIYHNSKKQKVSDLQKDQFAKSNGWFVIRVKYKGEINQEMLKGII